MHQEIFTSIVRLRSGRQQVPDANYFRGQFREALSKAHEEARNRGYPDEAIRDARFSVVAFLDESILILRSPVFADWPRKPLQEELFGVHMGGEVFFQNLERLMGQPDSVILADVLEVYLLSLLLGYAGKYSVSGKGELRSLRDAVLARIRRIRGYSPEFSPSWRPAAGAAGGPARDPWLRRLMVAAAVCLVLMLAAAVTYKVILSGGTSQVSTMASRPGVAQ